jgi:hypothetical protein
MVSDPFDPGGASASSDGAIKRAFVIHLRLPARSRRRRFAGQVEHLWSGDSVRFSSLRELLAFIAARTGERREPSAKNVPAANAAGARRQPS